VTEATSSGERVLVVDDEPDIVALVVYHLAKASYRVSSAGNGADALAQIRKERPALVVLDLMLPDMSGFDILEKMRSDRSLADVAVLTLTARGDEPDRIRGLTLGSDDYLTKPFSPQELVLRVGAILRRIHAGGRSGDVLRIDSLEIDRDSHRITVAGQDVELTPLEFKLLLLLAERRGRVQDRARLLESVWDAAPDIQTRTVDMHVQRLRTKLGSAGELIETVRGFGYRIRPSKADAK
jgi:two-component system, OmpR family, phosphate regulon response regulator PhoB